MADQSVSVTNLPDSGSKEAVALRLLNVVKQANVGVYKSKDEILDLYAECLVAVSGQRG